MKTQHLNADSDRSQRVEQRKKDCKQMRRVATKQTFWTHDTANLQCAKVKNLGNMALGPPWRRPWHMLRT